jgi:phospholipid/cholesterol/gamma-HCH transport system substrate-binding protein
MTMQRSIKVRWGALKVGAILVIAIAMLFWASLSGGGTSIFESKKLFSCYFKNVNGLISGSPVWMSGVEVGNVKSVKFVNIDSVKQVEVTFRVKNEATPMMTIGAGVQLGTIGFLGDKYVEIVPGPKGTPLHNELDVIPTFDVGDASAMFKAGEHALAKTGSLVGHLDTVLNRMSRGEGTLGQLSTNDKLYREMADLASSLTKLSDGLSRNQERLTGSIEKSSNAIDKLVDKIDRSEGTVGGLMNDRALYNNLASTTARLDSIAMKLNGQSGSAGMIVNDTMLYSEVTDLVSRISSLVADMEKHPGKYFKFSVF